MSVDWIFLDVARQQDLNQLFAPVLTRFSLPAQRLLCIFDDEDRPQFVSQIGDSFCGFFIPIRAAGLRNSDWPAELTSHVMDPYSGAFRCDVVIYVRKATCEHPTGATITFAHELQHFVQYGHYNKEWKANKGLIRAASQGKLDLKPWDFPIEYEAQLVSKQVSMAILGSKEVGRYAAQQIRSGNDPSKWSFFQGLDTSQRYDLKESTRLMEQRFT